MTVLFLSIPNMPLKSLALNIGCSFSRVTDEHNVFLIKATYCKCEYVGSFQSEGQCKHQTDGLRVEICCIEACLQRAQYSFSEYFFFGSVFTVILWSGQLLSLSHKSMEPLISSTLVLAITLLETGTFALRKEILLNLLNLPWSVSLCPQKITLCDLHKRKQRLTRTVLRTLHSQCTV